jgi:peroxiredoxin family protein
LAQEHSADKVTIILHSGAYDRASYALTLALGALASDMEVYMHLTYEGLRRFTKGHLADLGEETSPVVRAAFKNGLEAGKIQTLENRLTEAKELGLKLYACPASMAVLGIREEELLDEIDGIMGVVSFLKIARTAAINWYI